MNSQSVSSHVAVTPHALLLNSFIIIVSRVNRYKCSFQHFLKTMIDKGFDDTHSSKTIINYY